MTKSSSKIWPLALLRSFLSFKAYQRFSPLLIFNRWWRWMKQLATLLRFGVYSPSIVGFPLCRETPLFCLDPHRKLKRSNLDLIKAFVSLDNSSVGTGDLQHWVNILHIAEIFTKLSDVFGGKTTAVPLYLQSEDLIPLWIESFVLWIALA